MLSFDPIAQPPSDVDYSIAASSSETQVKPIEFFQILERFADLKKWTALKEGLEGRKVLYYDAEAFKEFHRFPANVFCAFETAIRLDGMPGDFLLHANQIKIDEYHCIATQYPYLEEGMSWFWEMVLQKGSVIVDLTNDEDMANDPSVSPYFPIPLSPLSLSSSSPSESVFVCQNGINIRFKNSAVPEDLRDVTLNMYEVVRAGDSTPQEMTRFHVKSWPDSQGTGVDDLLKILKLLLPYQADAEKCPIIHCRAGVGRTGTLTALLAASRLILEGKITYANLLDEVSRTVIEGRKQRNGLFVQVSAQFVVLVRACERILADPTLIS